MEKFPTYIKPAIFLGAIFGLGLGILLALPIVQLFVIFLFFGIGAFVVLMLRQNNFIQNFEQKDGAIIGGIAGFVSVISASIAFLAIALVSGSIFAGSYGMIRAFFMSFSAFTVLAILIFCIAFMNAIFNMGSAMLVITLFNNKQAKEEKPKFSIGNSNEE